MDFQEVFIIFTIEVENMKLYHTSIYMPDNLVNQCTNMMRKASRCRLSRHIKEWLEGEDIKHRYSRDDLEGAFFYICKFRPIPFEVGVEGGMVKKFAVRIHLDIDSDISIVINRENVAVTAWINRRDDLHYTLNAEKYEKF